MKRITFCGHADRFDFSPYTERILDTIESFVQDDDVEFLLGAYGSFDGFAFQCCRIYKQTHPSAKLIFVSPYLDDKYLENNEVIFSKYDIIETAPIESVPPRLKIIRRNEYMVDKSDLVIAYVDHGWGGAAMTYRYAKRRKKQVINLGNYKD